jgi:hypothetical protein
LLNLYRNTVLIWKRLLWAVAQIKEFSRMV